MITAILHVIYAVLIVAALYVAYDMGRVEAEMQNSGVVQ